MINRRIIASLSLLSAVGLSYSICMSYWAVNRVNDNNGKCKAASNSSYKVYYNPSDWWDCGGIPTLGCWKCNTHWETQTATTHYFDDRICQGNETGTSSSSESISTFTKWTSC